MSAGQNIETARQMYEAFGRGDVQAILDRVTDDVDWSTDAARHGKDELAGFFVPYAGQRPAPARDPAFAVARHRPPPAHGRAARA